MIDFLFQTGLSNACFSLALALVATVVAATTKRARIAHLLWLLVFVKLVTPPIVTIPVGILPDKPRHVAAAPAIEAEPGQDATVAAAPSQTQQYPTADESNPDRTGIESAPVRATSPLPVVSMIRASASRARDSLAAVWLLGGVVVLTWSLVRVVRFSRLLATQTEPASDELQATAARTAERLGLGDVPTIRTTGADLSPMVWWAGGRVRVVLPSALFDQIDTRQSQWILAHELAHVRRHDYLVRWLEWLACVCFWWNPVVWWAQRQLRAAEEICCDDLVISCLNPKPKHYADSLLAAVEFLSHSALRRPPMASEINSGGVLERRFKMILSSKTNRTNSWWLQIGILLCATVVLPLGLVSGAESQRNSNGGITRTRIAQALTNNGIPAEQVQDVMATLRPIMNEIESEGDAFALSPRIHRRLAGLGLAPEQIRAVVRIARRLSTALSQQAQQRQRIVASGVQTGIEAFVEAGAITPEDARARMAAYRRSVARRQRASEQEPMLANATARIRAAVADGTMTPEEGRAKLAARRERLAQETNTRLIAAATVRARAAVAAGTITTEQARARLAAYRASLTQQTNQQAPANDQTATAAARIRAAVAAGTMTAEEGRATMAAYRQRLAHRQQVDADIAGAVEGALNAYVETGQITATDAEAGLAAYRESVTERTQADSTPRARYQAAVARVRAAVANGTMTPEEGRAKLAAFQERLSQATE